MRSLSDIQERLIVRGLCAHMCRIFRPFPGIASLFAFLPHPTNLLPPLLFLRRPLLPQCCSSATVTSAVRSAEASTAVRIRRVSSPAQAKAVKAKCASTAFRRASSRATTAPMARLVHTVNARCLGTRTLSLHSTGTGPPCKTGLPLWTLRCAT